MDTVKCQQCRQVNFAHLTHCKRCQSPLGEANNFADLNTQPQRPAPTQTQAQPTAYAPAAPQYNQQYQQNNYQPFQAPPPPPVFHNQNQQNYNQHFYPPQQLYQQPQNCCVKCGSNDRSVMIQNFKKSYLPPVAYLGIFIGPLIFIILALILRVTHRLNAPFCGACWAKFKNQPVILTLINLVSVIVLFGGFILSFVTENFMLAALAIFGCIGVSILAKVYDSSVSPRYKKVDRNTVIIDAPKVGDVSFYR